MKCRFRSVASFDSRARRTERGSVSHASVKTSCCCSSDGVGVAGCGAPMRRFNTICPLLRPDECTPGGARRGSADTCRNSLCNSNLTGARIRIDASVVTCCMTGSACKCPTATSAPSKPESCAEPLLLSHCEFGQIVTRRTACKREL